eukprot:7640367-Pyramimonas_sp.AAC.1
MAEWREAWMYPGAAGARQHHHYQAIAWELNLEIDQAYLTRTPMSGCTADRKKFFDPLEYEIGDKLMDALGCRTGVLRAPR